MDGKPVPPHAGLDRTAAAPVPIARRSLHAELLGPLRDLIIEGHLAPGAKVPERDLCERFGVSRTPMREALKVLASEGLVTLTPNRGAMVAPLTLPELEEVFPVMGALEALAGELAARAITDAEIATIADLHRRMLACYRARDRKGYFAANEAIHVAILAAACNPTLTHTYRSLAGRVRRARYLANMSERRWAEAVAEHEQILALLAARSGKRLASVLRHHLDHKLDTVRDALFADARGEHAPTPRTRPG